jgi:hypothetical protein
MGQFPHASVPTSLELDDQAANFMDDLRLLAKDLQILGNGIIIRAGSGTPEGVIVAKQGSLFLRLDGGATTTLYVKTSGTGSSGWTAK